MALKLKLFRSTGYASLLLPGENRLATHPLRLVLLASLWLALVANVGVWRLLAGTATDPHAALASVLLLGGGSGLFFSLMGWRRTVRAAISVGLVAAALVACALWSQQLPIDTLWHGPLRSLLPAWAIFLRWQVLALVLALALVPIVWLWNTSVRRLSALQQLRSNAAGAVLAAVVFAAGVLALSLS
jgi:lipid A ethanolaminephosphotransferase